VIVTIIKVAVLDLSVSIRGKMLLVINYLINLKTFILGLCLFSRRWKTNEWSRIARIYCQISTSA